MRKVSAAIKKALADFASPTVWMMLFTPILISAMIVIYFIHSLWEYFNTLTSLFFNAEFFIKFMAQVSVTLTQEQIANLIFFSALVLSISLFFVLFYTFVIIVSSLMVTPLAILYTQKKHYSRITGNQNYQFFTALFKAFKMTIYFFFVWLCFLPLYFIPFFALVIQLVLTTIINKNMFCHEILTEYSEPTVSAQILKQNAALLYILSFLNALIFFIPFANLFAPAITALSFSHFLMKEIQDRTVGR